MRFKYTIQIIKTVLVSFIIFTTFQVGYSQEIYSEKFYNAYIYDRMDEWQSICDIMQNDSITDSNYIFEKLNYLNGYIGHCLENEEYSKAKKYLEILNTNISYAKNQDYNSSLLYTYKSSAYAYSIGINNYLAPIYGKKNREYAELAIKSDSSNYLAYMQLANSYRYTPYIFGGSKIKALSYYKQSELIYLQNLNAGSINLKEKNWNYLWLLVAISETYFEIEEYDKSLKYCNKILAIEPSFTYVEKTLLKKILLEMKK